MGEALKAGVAADRAAVLCIIIHGRWGAPEVMMHELVRHLTAPNVYFVLPRADDNQWYKARTADPLTELTRAELAAAIAQVEADIAAAVAAGAPADRMIVAGFSQGGCLSLEYARARGAWQGALCSLTGCRLGQPGDARAPVADLTGLPVYMSNGDADPFILLPSFTDTLCDVAAARARVRCDLFPGRHHQMSPPEIAMLDAMLRSVAMGADPFGPAAVMV
jgi:predicted esterase